MITDERYIFQHAKKLLFICLFVTGFSFTLYVQQDLPEVTVRARNYMYLKSMDQSAAQPVQLLRRQMAAYDVKESEIYQDDYDTYAITFYLPRGYILAVYDSTGQLISTAEKFKNVALPHAVTAAVSERYPNWGITNDTYIVNYKDGKEAHIIYKLILQNGNKRLRVKLDEKGDFKD
ncbi:nicotinate-nucleotide adenylyltransferase [Chitinophaga agri]|uniref:Nicotinate-nucleotide adenylyltransferase n=2 Tax=Chitinophaga agri TaxID=2703787 RepID=A0A6B9ZNQ7_9BACT|nr:nicotinate-nucleotide adenylyltransferase [Chitinophaga agri]